MRPRGALRNLRFWFAVPFAVGWAVREHRALGHTLDSDGVAAVVAPPARRLPLRATGAVGRVLALRRATCLERSLILQAWFAAHGACHDVVIGVRRHDGIQAHAWLDRLEDVTGFAEIHRLPAR